MAKHLTTGRNRTYWCMRQPLIVSKEVFAKLPRAQQDVMMAVGAEMETFGENAAKADDKLVGDVYAKAGAKVVDMDDATLQKWQVIARNTAWKDYAEKNESCAALIKAAQALL